MKLSYSFYTLTWRHSNGERVGALLRLQEGDCVGYADCHPWPELGELPIEDQLKVLREGHLTPLLQQTLFFARIDAKSRFSNSNLFEGIEMPPSHVLIQLHEVKREARMFEEKGIKLFKIKVTKQDIEEIIHLTPHISERGIRWRLDFNASLTFSEALPIFEKLKSIGASIDFVEDPCPYGKEEWEKLEEKSGIQLAGDFVDFGNSSVSVTIHKPCTRPLRASIFQRLIVTSSLGHPLGQLAAAYAAATCKETKQESGGFLSHFVYKENLFSQSLYLKEGKLVAPSGTGFGFDPLLEGLPWTPLE